MMSLTTTPATHVADAVLELRGVKAVYGKVEVLHGVDLVVPGGQVLAVLGPNGAGKSTMLRVASGLHPPSGGDIYMAGRKVTGVRPETLARAGICTIPEGRGIFPNLTVRENQRMWGFCGGVTLAEIEDRSYARFPRLAERRAQLAGTLSGGEQQMLAMSRALATNARVLLLDEISMGLAPMVVAELYDVVRQLADDGISILLVEQFARTALEVADRVGLMSRGVVEREGHPAEIGTSVDAAYFGSDVQLLTETEIRF
jgi:branched-chain amino acid transport system ATP-binding protein